MMCDPWRSLLNLGKGYRIRRGSTDCLYPQQNRRGIPLIPTILDRECSIARRSSRDSRHTYNAHHRRKANKADHPTPTSPDAAWLLYYRNFSVFFRS